MKISEGGGFTRIRAGMEMAVAEREAGSPSYKSRGSSVRGRAVRAGAFWSGDRLRKKRRLSSSLSFLVVASAFEESRWPLLFLEGR